MHGALEEILEHQIERIEEPFVLYQRGPRQIVELVDVRPGDAFIQRFQKRQIFPDRDGDPGFPEVIEKLDEHRGLGVPVAGT